MATPPKPWKAEYAKSSRAGCRTCSKSIGKDTFRLGKMQPSRQFDGFMPVWHHANCIFKKKAQIKELDDVEGVDTLRWEDQQKVRKYIEGNLVVDDNDEEEAKDTTVKAKSTKAKAKGKGGDEQDDNSGEYAIEIAKSSRSTCKSCEEKIEKGQVRISVMVESNNARFRGKTPAWRHPKCFFEMGWWTSPMADMPGWDNLSAEDQASVEDPAKSSLGGVTPATGGKGSKRKEVMKESPKTAAHPSKVAEKVPNNVKEEKPKKRQKKKADGEAETTAALNKKPLDKKVPKDKETVAAKEDIELDKRLEMQTKDIWTIKDNLRQHVTNAELREMLMTNSQDTSGSEYDLRERCGTNHRRPRKVNGCFCHPHQLRVSAHRTPRLHRDEVKIRTQTVFFSGCEFHVMGKLSMSHAKWKEKIEAVGGRIRTGASVAISTTCVVVAESSLENEKIRRDLDYARCLRPVMREEYLIRCLEKHTKLPMDEYMLELGTDKEPILKVKVKGRGAVHEDSGLQETGHILEEGQTIYSTTLNISELSTGINSYYVLQIIEEDDKKTVHHIFRKWGRIGNSRIGGQKLEKLSKTAAIKEFKRLFREKTGNEWEAWESRENFVKQPGKFYPLEIDYGVSEGPLNDLVPAGSKSKLHPQVLNLMKLLFDIETYKAAMMEFEINISEMPLGKLSKCHIEQGYQVLTEIQNLMVHVEDDAHKDGLLVDASNRFFTLIPTVHPTVICTEQILKSKIEMLEALRDIEIASELIRSRGEDGEEDPLDANYKKLQCDIVPLPHDSPDFELVNKYLMRTHAPTHTDWALELEDVYALDREGELDAYLPFKETLKNRTLLWHGSRTTNYVGILSQGLRIAPPEAPVTGYMFGKGVYFADLVSKSAQYCYTSKKNPTGLLLLSEVALGATYELRSAKYMEKPVKGTHSTKGLGKMKPLESEFERWDDNVTVPCGRPVSSGVRSELMYNEYIVYDSAQVKLRFLLKVKFKHKH